MWTTTFKIDEDRTVGTATASFQDVDGKTLVTYSDRVEQTAQSRNDFVREAKRILTKFQNKATQEGNIADNLTQLLNT